MVEPRTVWLREVAERREAGPGALPKTPSVPELSTRPRNSKTPRSGKTYELGLPRIVVGVDLGIAGNGVGVDQFNALETEQVFREANRSIADVAAELNTGGRVPFLCECSDPNCREIIRMPWSEFEAVHRHDQRFIVAPGHELLEIEQLVAETGVYNVVEK